MGIKERIKKLETYFKEMQITSIDGKQVIYVVVIFPNGWVVDDEIVDKYDVTFQRGQYQNEYYFCTEIENGEDKVFDAIEYNIEKMKEAIERSKLLTEKTLELKKIFENENISLSQLKTLKITYDEILELVIPKNSEKNNKEEKKEANE
jgi:hypothetical protein